MVTIDRSAQVLRIDCTAPHDGALFAAPPFDRFVSASLLAHKVKQVDDAVRQAVELMTQRGAGHLPSRRLLLAKLADALARTKPGARGDAVEVVFAACRLGGVEAHPKPAMRAAVEARVAAHRADPRFAPVGFYTRSPELMRAYAQDRVLQTRLTDAGAVTAVAAPSPTTRGSARPTGRTTDWPARWPGSASATTSPAPCAPPRERAGSGCRSTPPSSRRRSRWKVASRDQASNPR